MNKVKITIVTFLIMLSTSVAYGAASYRVTNGGTSTIDEHTVCKKVTNFCGKDLFVPTNTAAEWSDFRSDLPGCASLTDCGIACGTLVQFLACTGTSLIGSPIGSAATCELWCEQQVSGSCCHWASGEGGGFCEVRDGTTTAANSGDYSATCN